MTTVISVRFRNGNKTYYFDPRELEIAAGTGVIVETSQGVEYATCVEGNHPVEDDAVVAPLRAVVRIATANDRHTIAYNRSREKEAFDICQKKIVQHGLEMKLVRTECSFDGSKLLFFFTADGRVDFRELVKDLAGVFRSRIELRQIGVRDEAKMLGGLGICGRPFCCSAYLDDFLPVSIKMAKTQNLSLNPTKISGTCGRLMCCLNYEQAAYEDATARLPKAESFVLTPDGPGNVTDVNLLKETVSVRLDEHPESASCYRSCEVCVLRNGKGSRDGIEIPRTLPDRYVEPREPEIAPAAETAETEGRSRRSRRSRGARSAAAAPAPVPETPAKKEPAPSEKPTSSRRSRRGRGGKAAPKPDAAPKAPKAPAPTPAPASEAAAPNARKKSHYRGNRRRGKPASGGNHAEG